MNRRSRAAARALRPQPVNPWVHGDDRSPDIEAKIAAHEARIKWEHQQGLRPGVDPWEMRGAIMDRQQGRQRRNGRTLGL